MPDGAEHQRRWDAWMQRMETARETPLFLSATRSLTRDDPSLPSTPAATGKSSGKSKKKSPVKPVALPRKKPASQSGSSDQSAIIGTLAHRVLHGWDFSADPAAMPTWIEDCCRMYLPKEWVSESDSLCAELQELFTHFIESEPYAVLCQADILGREIPFVVPWESMGAEYTPASVMQGVIDVMYRRDQQIWIADYKTNRVEKNALAQVVQEYRTQMEIYRRAAESALGQGPIRAQLIFLRSGLSVEV